MNYNIRIPKKAFLDRFHHLSVDEDIDIDLIYGGRDSGKSRDTAQRYIVKCLSDSYFRCILAKKQFNTVQESQWQMIKDVVSKWGLEDLFVFKTHPLEIICANGNRFVGRGFDDPGKIKSFSNPSHTWVEEGNQLTEDDWTVLITSLRSDYGRIKVDMTFNPECDGRYQDFWLWKQFFKGKPEGEDFRAVKTYEVKGKSYNLTYRVTHATYDHNPFCPAQRIAFHEGLLESNPYWHRVFTKGLFGVREVTSPFVYNFKATKHVGRVVFDPKHMTYLSFDFNRNPICCSIWQLPGDDKIRCVEVIKLPNSDIYKLCDVIDTRYPNADFIVTGDSTGLNSSALVRDDLNYYDVIQDKLRLMDGQIQLRNNPKIEENQVHCNRVLASFDVLMDEENCQGLIFDCMFGEIRADGKLKKENREDPTQQLDCLDTMRYLFNRFVEV